MPPNEGEHGSTISVITWFLLVATALAVITRIATKLAISNRINLDDFVVFTALLLSTGQSIAVSFEARLNRSIDTLDSAQLERFQQSMYAAGLLHIPSLCLAKLSVSLLLRLITPNVLHNRLILGVEVTTVLWALTAELVAAFQCHLPTPWKFLGNKCFDRTAFWTYFGIMNIITDLILVLLPLGIVWGLQVNVKRKIVVAGCFASRLVVIAAIIVQLTFLNRTANSQNPTRAFWTTAICTQVVQTLSIITACIPYLKPFFESLESGMIRSDDLRRRGMKWVYGSQGGKSAGSTTLGSGKAPSRLTKASDTPHELGEIPSTGNLGFGHHANATTITATTREDWDDGSETSQSKIIRQTTTWAVNAEP